MKKPVADMSDKPMAIRQLYEVFARYPARADMPRCEHCANNKAIERICATRLEELAADSDLCYYAGHALTTVGEVIDFKHFLPRIFETLLYSDGGIDAEIVVGKLPYGHWRQWPSSEQAAISAFLFDWWKHLLSHYPAEHEAGSCLCAIARAEDDLSGFLDYWRRCSGPAPLQHVADMLMMNHDRLMAGKPLYNSWWQESQRQMSQLQDWLLSPLTGKALEDGYFAFPEGSIGQRLSDAVQQFSFVQEAMTKRRR